MRLLYYSLAALHIVTLVVTGILWTLIDLEVGARLRPQLQDIRAVHFGSLYLVPWFLALSIAFEGLHVPEMHQLAFPAGLGLLVLFSGIAYLLPRPADLAPFYFWTRGWPLVLSLIGLAGLIVGLLWTAVVLVVYAVLK